MAFASCAHYESGYFTAYRGMAEDRPDLILHLGDYIYEDGAGTGGGPRSTRAPRSCRWPTTAAGTRSTRPTRTCRRRTRSRRGWWCRTTTRWRTTTPNMVRDDNSPHADRRAVDRAGVPPRTRPTTRTCRCGRASAGAATASRSTAGSAGAAGHLPHARHPAVPRRPGLRRRLEGLRRTRTWPDRTITGAAQEAWLLDGLAQHLGTWDILGQQVFFARQRDASRRRRNMDAWDGYRAVPRPDPARLAWTGTSATRWC